MYPFFFTVTQTCSHVNSSSLVLMFCFAFQRFALCGVNIKHTVQRLPAWARLIFHDSFVFLNTAGDSSFVSKPIFT